MIIEAAIKRFAQKGFTSTSVQEIANDSGISKGAFYLHFKSKEALLLAILHYYFETLHTRVTEIENKPLPPRERFATQLKVLLEALIEHKEFLIMQSREQAIPLNAEVKKMIFKMHSETHNFYHRNLINIYGDSVNPYLWDLSFIIDGILHSYLRLLFLTKESSNLEAMATFLYNRIDDLVTSLVKSEETPMITEESMNEMLRKANMFFSGDKINVKTILANMKQELENIENKEDLEVTLEVLESEISRDNPRSAVIHGMLSNFANHPQFKQYIAQIKKIYQ